MGQKILYIVTKGNWGGAQKYVFEMAVRSAKAGFGAVVAFGEGDALPAKLGEKNIPAIKIPRLGRDFNIIKDVLVFFDLLKLLWKEKPDIVHLNSSKIGGLGALAARLLRIDKIIFTVHGFAFNENRSWLEKKIIAFLSWLTIVFSTDVIFISKTELERACRWPFIRDKAELIYNGIEAPDFLSRDEAQIQLAEHLHVSPKLFSDKKIIGTIAELTGNKGLAYGIDAFKDIEDALYIVIGQGELQAELQGLIQKNNLEKKVFLAGFMKDASRFLKAFDLFVLPSVKEGVPYVVLEAGFAELAIVGTDVGGMREIIADGISGIIVPPAQSSALRAAADKLLNDREMRNSFGRNLHETIVRHHALVTTVEKTLALYGQPII